jgi:transcriptional regulator with XRE-family HTH domain
MPLVLPDPDVAKYLVLAGQALGKSQEQLGEQLGVARRTMSRWVSGDTTPSVGALQKLARLVHPVDAGLASRLAAEGGTTLETLGIVVARPAPPPPPAAPEPPSIPPRPFPPVRLMLNAILYASTEASKASSGDVRTVIAAAFECARGLGLTAEEVADALAGRDTPTPAQQEPPAPTKDRKPATARARN